MSGNNMESLLLGGDDSSSGDESDGDVSVGGGGGGAVAAASVVAAAVAAAAPAPPPQLQTPPQAPPAPAAPQQQQLQQPAAMSQSEMSMRLKSMYSPASKVVTGASANVGGIGASQHQQQAPMPPTMQPAHPVAPSYQQPQAPMPAPQQQQHRPPVQQASVSARGGIAHQVSAATVARHASSVAPPPPLPPGPPSHRGRSDDPFEPTPVAKIIERHERHQQLSAQQHQHQQHVQHRAGGIPHQQPSRRPAAPHPGAAAPAPNRMGPPPPGAVAAPGGRPSSSNNAPYPSSQSSVASSVSTVTTSNLSQQDRERELKRQKEKFLVFTRVLLRYLEQKDPPLHLRVKAVIKDCADRNRRGEAGYESVTSSMRTRLKEIVSDAYWKRAEAYLQHFLASKQRGGATPLGGGGSSVTGGGGVPPPPGAGSGGAVTAKPGGLPHPAGVAAGGGSAAAAAALAEKQRDEARRKMELQRQQRKQQQQSRPSPGSASAGPAGAPGGHHYASSSSQQPSASHPSVSSLQRDIAKQRQALSGSSGHASSAAGAAPTAPSGGASAYPGSTLTKQQQQQQLQQAGAAGKGGRGGKGSRGSGSKQLGPGGSPAPSLPRKPSLDNRSAGGNSALTLLNKEGLDAAATSASNNAAAAAPPPPVYREYAELMEMVDHVVPFDWTTAGLMLGTKAQSLLSDEQTQLLYQVPQGSSGAPVDGGTESPAAPAFPLPNWSRRNLVSARLAWARLRLPEHRRAAAVASAAANPSRSSFSSPPPVSEQQPGAAPSAAVDTSWHNEQVAEQDAALAALSEATELYIKSILEKAVFCGRLRLNLDGIRLWHQQMTPLPTDDSSKPALALCLGCDVTRQVARAAGNAALASKRMEEALERQVGVPAHARAVNDETLAKASSMSDLALRPKLAEGAHRADLEAQRNFEIYGGKDAQEPPLGRVPKRARLEVVDFQLGMQLAGQTSKRRQRAFTLSSSFAF